MADTNNPEGIKGLFTFQNLPLTITIGLIIMAWLSIFSVILFA
ncbi:hypothetical protein [Methylobacillus sp.]